MEMDREGFIKKKIKIIGISLAGVGENSTDAWLLGQAQSR